MSKPRPPKVDWQAVNDLKLNDFDKLRTRFRQLISEMHQSERSPEWISLEGLAAIFGAHLGGHDPERLRNAWPVAQWREQTIEVPIGFVEVLARAWYDYTHASQGESMGKVFGVEGRSRPTRSAQSKDDKDRRLANEALLEYAARGDEGDPISWRKVYKVVGKREGASEKSVEDAYKRYGMETRRKLAMLGILDK